MSYKALFAGACFLVCALSAGSAEDTEKGNAERYIKQSESQWAEAGVTGNTETIERILAADFVGVDPEGNFYGKARELADTREKRSNYVFNNVNEVKVRFFGATAVAQGSESWERRAGEPRRGRYVWTDTWVRRNNKWQVVAAEDLVAAEVAR